MPHQCVRCNKLYDDGSQELLKGCSCGGKFFFYIKKEALAKARTIATTLTDEEKEQIEKDVFDILGTKYDDEPVFLDIESIKILKPGHYELDLVHLFKGKPLVYKLADGKYVIDLISTFESKDKDLDEAPDETDKE